MSAAESDLFARQGDTLDALIWRERGLGADDIAGVLDANPGLAALGAVLPVGTRVHAPPRPRAAPVHDLIKLWD
ncbi:MAG: tail protein X [Allosphingosinicella sp.]|uniref:tail protein X n=1 Tax=Allosphingosinicella sp. TaxID=2823234 RepID=UPI003959FC23